MVHNYTGNHATLTLTYPDGTTEVVPVLVTKSTVNGDGYSLWHSPKEYTFELRSCGAPEVTPHPLAKLVKGIDDGIRLVQAGIVTEDEIREFWKLPKKKR